MRDLEINIGYIGNDIIALCEDRDFEYAFVATRAENKYQTRLASTHGFITNNEYPVTIGHRQMILLSIAKHYDALDAMVAKQQVAENESQKNKKVPKSLH